MSSKNRTTDEKMFGKSNFLSPIPFSNRKRIQNRDQLLSLFQQLKEMRKRSRTQQVENISKEKPSIEAEDPFNFKTEIQIVSPGSDEDNLSEVTKQWISLCQMPPAPLKFEELDFGKQKVKLGQGASAKVYAASYKGIPIAVKMLNIDEEKNFKRAEAEILSLWFFLLFSPFSNLLW